jgi:glycosyltransferase involved in cell wall biosynthesis
MGRISFEKNMHWIAAALGLLKQQERLPKGMKVFIVGPPHHAEAQALLDAMIREYGLGDVVIQHPSTNAPEDYYAACDATILVSPNEGLPNVVIESLSAGRPVIISAAANAAHIVEDGSTGWVVRTGDIPQLADTVACVAALPDETFRRMRSVCMVRASEYSIKRLVSHYMSVYAQLATGRPNACLSAP